MISYFEIYEYLYSRNLLKLYFSLFYINLFSINVLQSYHFSILDDIYLYNQLINQQMFSSFQINEDLLPFTIYNWFAFIFISYLHLKNYHPNYFVLKIIYEIPSMVFQTQNHFLFFYLFYFLIIIIKMKLLMNLINFSLNFYAYFKNRIVYWPSFDFLLIS